MTYPMLCAAADLPDRNDLPPVLLRRRRRRQENRAWRRAAGIR